jgi:hypothetical protein
LRPAVKSLVLSRDYRSKLLRTLVRLYRAVALMAYQIAVNMFESAKQQFLSRVFITIRKTASVATSKDVASTDESIDSEGKKVNPGLFLLEENLDNFQAQVPYLMFLPTLLLLEDMVGKVRGEEVEFKEVIRRLLHCMDRECVNVRLQTLNTEYMLPRLVVEVLSWGGEGEMQDIMLEVKSIADPTVESLGDTTKMSTPQSGVEEKMLESNLQQLVAQALFPVLDHIGTWLRTKFSTLMLATRKQESQLKPEEIQTALKKSQEYIRVNTFKDQIPHDGLAYLSYQTRTYHRSAFHLDQYLKLTNIRTTGSTWLSSLQKLYAALEEPDLVLGVAAVREEEPKLEDLILQHEATGNNKDVLCCYERQGKTVSGDIQSGNLGIIQCYLSIDQPATTASLAAVLVPKQRDLAVDLAPLQTEAAWQLGMWEDLEKYSATEGEEEEEMGWQLELGKVLFNVKKQQWGDMKQVLAKLRGQLVEPLSAGSLEQGAYHRGYTNINMFSMLCEVEKLDGKFLLTSESELATTNVGATELLSEMSYTQNSCTSLEPMSRLRRAVLGLARDRIRLLNSHLADRLQFEIGECWLRSTQVAQKSGQLQEAYSFLLELMKSMLGSEVVQLVVGRETVQRMVQALAETCSTSRYTCSLAKTVTTRLVMKEKEENVIGSTNLITPCSLCDGWTERMRTPAKGGRVASKDVEPFLKLIGHQDPLVRHRLVSTLSPWCKHSTMSPAAASMWLTCVSDSEDRVRVAFSSSLSYILGSKTDTLGWQDSVTATNSNMELKSYCRLVDTLLELYSSPNTTVTIYVRALPTLQAAMSTHKNHLVYWCAKAMCQNQYNPKGILLFKQTDTCSGVVQLLIENGSHHLRAAMAIEYRPETVSWVLLFKVCLI